MAGQYDWPLGLSTTERLPPGNVSGSLRLSQAASGEPKGVHVGVRRAPPIVLTGFKLRTHPVSVQSQSLVFFSGF
jgi:hypothetical protein